VGNVEKGLLGVQGEVQGGFMHGVGCVTQLPHRGSKRRKMFPLTEDVLRKGGQWEFHLEILRLQRKGKFKILIPCMSLRRHKFA